MRNNNILKIGNGESKKAFVFKNAGVKQKSGIFRYRKTPIKLQIGIMILNHQSLSAFYNKCCIKSTYNARIINFCDSPFKIIEYNMPFWLFYIFHSVSASPILQLKRDENKNV